jgi:predicted subunit of tRNA(5-methylaminomethyl-2-thiouridylate) methyltransferase
MARAIEDRAELEFCRAIVSATNTVVCRLTASVEMMEQRVRMRESRMMQQDYLARVRALNAILDRARVEDFIVNSANRSVTEIAQEMLIKVEGFVSKTGG